MAWVASWRLVTWASEGRSIFTGEADRCFIPDGGIGCAVRRHGAGKGRQAVQPGCSVGDGKARWGQIAGTAGSSCT